mmetsp:Transcript_59192/g.141035  ORF Transcript_59192/g.141035 Transcript_59192/m.141035 type:complete len:295 (-) Transcript_59192:507-1391(-)
MRHPVALPVFEIVADHGNLRRRTAHLADEGVGRVLCPATAGGDYILSEGHRMAVGATVPEAADAHVGSLALQGLALLQKKCRPAFGVHVGILHAEVLVGRDFRVHAGQDTLAEGRHPCTALQMSQVSLRAGDHHRSLPLRQNLADSAHLDRVSERSPCTMSFVDVQICRLKTRLSKSCSQQALLCWAVRGREAGGATIRVAVAGGQRSTSCIVILVVLATAQHCSGTAFATSIAVRCVVEGEAPTTEGKHGTCTVPSPSAWGDVEAYASDEAGIQRVLGHQEVRLGRMQSDQGG